MTKNKKALGSTCGGEVIPYLIAIKIYLLGDIEFPGEVLLRLTSRLPDPSHYTREVDIAHDVAPNFTYRVGCRYTLLRSGFQPTIEHRRLRPWPRIRRPSRRVRVHQCKHQTKCRPPRRRPAHSCRAAADAGVRRSERGDRPQRPAEAVRPRRPVAWRAHCGGGTVERTGNNWAAIIGSFNMQFGG